MRNELPIPCTSSSGKSCSPPLAPCGLRIRVPQAGRGWLAIRKQHIVRLFVNVVFSIALNNGKQSKERCHVTAAIAGFFRGFDLELQFA